MPKKKRVKKPSKARRSRISKKRKEFLRRSKASKKGWRRRKAKEKIAERGKQKLTGKGKLREWIVNFSYFGAKTSRILGFTVIARNEQDALTFVYKAVANGEDSAGSDLTWVSQIDWSEVDVTTPIEDESEKLQQKEIKELGEGWVEVH